MSACSQVSTPACRYCSRAGSVSVSEMVVERRSRPVSLGWRALPIRHTGSVLLVLRHLLLMWMRLMVCQKLLLLLGGAARIWPARARLQALVLMLLRHLRLRLCLCL